MTDICPSGGNCVINTPQNESITINSDYLSITNNTNLITINNNETISSENHKIEHFTNNGLIKNSSSSGVKISGFKNDSYVINNGIIDVGRDKNAIQWESDDTGKGYFLNTGEIKGKIIASGNFSLETFNNTGKIYGGIDNGNSNQITIKSFNNTGEIHLLQKNGNFYHIGEVKPVFSTYALHINENNDTFNAFTKYNQEAYNTGSDMSHLVLKLPSKTDESYAKIKKDAKFIINPKSGFSLGKEYNIEKLILNTSGESLFSDATTNKATLNLLQYEDGSSVLLKDFSKHLKTSNPLFKLTFKNASSFEINLDLKNSLGNSLAKTEINKMNKFMLQTHSLLFNQVSSNIKIALNNPNHYASIEELRDNFRFYYKNDKQDSMQYSMQDSTKETDLERSSIIAADNRRTKIRNERSISRNLKTTTQSTKSSQQNDIYLFFSPFVSHTSFYKSGGMDYSGLDYGFISGISGRLGNINTLGVHFGFSYGNLKEKSWNANINNIMLNLGLHYKLDFIYDIYFKIIGDVFYSLNEIKGNFLKQKYKPNDLGFAGSAYFGKDFNFKQAGILSLELGASYQGINLSRIDTELESYDNQLINLIYVDLNAKYLKIFNNGLFINSTLGAKILATTPSAALEVNTLVGESRFKYNITTDRFLGYINLGFGYRVGSRIEIGLDYLGVFGDKSMNNSGFLNAKFWW